MNINTLFATALAGLTGIAAATPVDADAVGTPITAEILQGWQQADGTRVTAIKFTLAQGWKTYWRAPGDGGIPPSFDWAGSKNLSGVAITWPTPQVMHQNGMRTIGYSDALILPLTVSPRHDGKPVQLSAEIDLGVCKDICVPQTLRVSATLDTTSTTPSPTIAAAIASRPYGAKEAGVRSATCALSPNADGLEINATLSMPKTGGREVVVIEADNDQIWVSETDTKRSGTKLTARADMVSFSGGAFALDRSALRITVLGKRQAVEIIGCAAD